MTAHAQKSRIDDRLIEEAKADVVEVIGRYVELKKEGAEHVACCPFHSERSPSFKVNGTKGFFKCFGCGEHGDAIDFVMKIDGLTMPEAIARIIGREVGGPSSIVPTPPRIKQGPAIQPIVSVPDSVGPPDFKHWRLGTPSKVWSYCNAAGDQVGYVARFETMHKGKPGKETLPLTWACNMATGEIDWNWAAFALPRTLYGAELLAQHPDKPVLVVEGEKTADAARAIFTGFVVVTWPGGANAVDMANWELLHGRAVVLWGDWDAKQYKPPHERAGDLMGEREQPGTKAMERIYAHLRGRVESLRFVTPMEGAPDGWDLADAPPAEGFTPLAWAKQNTVPAVEYFERPAAQAPAPIPADGAPIPPPAANDNLAFPVPLDVFGLAKPSPMPIDVLPECLRTYTADQSALTGCDAGIIGMAALVACAATIHDGIKLQPKRHDPTWTESTRLWLAIVAPPSAKKSPGIAKAVRHIKRHDLQMAENNITAMAAWKRQHMDWKEAKKADRNLPAPEPQQPPQHRAMVEDVTVEALTDILKDNARGIMVLKDELTGWFASMDAYRGGGKSGASMDRAHWLEAYNGGRRTIDRVTRGAIVVPNWSACMVGGIQPDMIKRVVNNMGNDGLLQRFIVYNAADAVDDADRTPDMQAIQAYSALFDGLAAIKPSENLVQLEAAAHASRERVASYSRRLLGAVDHAHLQAWLGKWDGLYARLLLVYHVLDCTQRSKHPANVRVSGETAAQVERLMCGVLLPHALHFYTETIDVHDRQENVRQLARLLLAKRLLRITKRDIALMWKASRKLEGWELRAVIDGLCTTGWLEPDHEGGLDMDGKPRAWWINPAVHEMFDAHGQREAQRRTDAAAALRELRDAYGRATGDS